MGFDIPQFLGITGLELLIAVAAVLVGSCLQGALGFGLGLVSAPVLVILNADLVPAALLAIGLPLAASVVWRERADLDLRMIRWAILGRIPGTIIGSLSVALLSRQVLSVGFGVVILAAVAVSTFGLAITPTRRNLFVAGVLSGVSGTATSVGGPPVALVYQQMPGAQVRAALSFYMVVGAVGSLVALGLVGEVEPNDLLVAAILSPVVMVGFVVSRRVVHIVDQGLVRPAVLVFASLSAVSIVVRAFM